MYIFRISYLDGDTYTGYGNWYKNPKKGILEFGCRTKNRWWSGKIDLTKTLTILFIDVRGFLIAKWSKTSGWVRYA